MNFRFGARSRSKTRIPFSFTDSEAAVLATIEAQDPRLGKVFASLVRHLHSFVKDTRPSQEEWIAGVMWLQRVGVMSVDPAVRFEWMLLSDTLGVSMLVQVRAQQSPGVASPSLCPITPPLQTLSPAINRSGERCALTEPDQVLNGLLHEHGTTEGTVQGPFKGNHPIVATHGANLCLDGSDTDPAHPAVPCLVSGKVLDAVSGAPIDAKIDVWLTSADGQVGADHLKPEIHSVDPESGSTLRLL